MAEAIARHDASDAIDAFSAGLAAIGFVTEMTKKTLMRNGYWVEDLESKAISAKIWEQVDLIINMSGRPKEEAFREYSKVEDWEIEDPYGDDPKVHQRAFEKIRLRVAELAERCRGESAAARTNERRAHARVFPAPPIFISLNGEHDAQVLDISEGGLALSSDMALPNRPLRDLRMQFLGSSHSPEVPCRIAWRSKSNKQAGIQFAGLTNELRWQIRDWISAQACASEP